MRDLVRRAPYIAASRLAEAVTRVPWSSHRAAPGGRGVADIRAELGRLRVAVVKPDTLPDLWCVPPGTTGAALAESTLQRSGPVGLYVDSDCAGFIVRHSDAPESQLWRERVRHCGQKSLEFYAAEVPGLRARNPRYAAAGTIGDFTVEAESVDWDAFDLVVVFDMAIPSAVAERHPGVTWASMIGEPCCLSYARSHLRCPPGYSAFLNQRARPAARSLNPDEIDFPYYLQRPGCLDTLEGARPGATRTGTTLEFASGGDGHAAALTALAAVGPMRRTSTDQAALLGDLTHSTYFVKLAGNPLWGNGLIEAIAAGCVVVCDRSEVKNPDVLGALPALRGDRAIVEFVELLERQPDRRAALAVSQRDACQTLCYDEPLRRLLAIHRSVAVP